MKQKGKKSGVSMGGSIEYTRNIKSVKCNCSSCFHSRKAAGTIYCSYYDKFSPTKKKCVRFSPKENYSKGKERQKAPLKSKGANQSIMSTYVPTFPWEMP